MCLGMGMYNTIPPNTAESRKSVSILKGLMVAELCVAMCKMFIFQNIMNGIFELFTVLLLYMAYSQLSFCYCLIYILYSLYQIINFLVLIATYIQNGTRYFKGGIESAQAVFIIILILFYIVACYLVFQAYKNFKSESMAGMGGGNLLGGGANRQGNNNPNDSEQYQNYGGSGYQGYGRPQPQQQQQRSQPGFQAFQGQGVKLG